MGEHISGFPRDRQMREAVRLYEGNESIRPKTIRQVAEEMGISYGKAHALLNEAKTVLRQRGGRGARDSVKVKEEKEK